MLKNMGGALSPPITVGLTRLRGRLSDLLAGLTYGRGPIVVTRHGRAFAKITLLDDGEVVRDV
ncbi:MAG: hypothetical protein WCK89_17860 [bacterium]